MRTDRRTAVIWAVLLIMGIVFGVLNTVPIVEQAEYLSKLASMKMEVMAAVFFQAAMAVVYVCVAAILYPVIKKYDERLAIGYFGFRIIGAAFLFVGIVSLLLLLLLSQQYVSAGSPKESYDRTIGELLRNGRDLMNHVCMILPWSIGGVILYYCSLKMRLLPTWLSLWGIIGSVLTVAATLLLMLDLIKIVTPAYLLLNTPTALFELSLAVYLLIKGFNHTVSARKIIQ